VRCPAIIAELSVCVCVCVCVCVREREREREGGGVKFCACSIYHVWTEFHAGSFFQCEHG